VSWSTRPEDLILTVKKEHQKLVKDMVAFVWVQVTTSSPVDTGRYAGNHNVSSGVPNGSYNYNKTNPSKSVDLGRVEVTVGDDSFRTFWVSNGLPYAEALENGHSQRAPRGVYGPAFALASHRLRSRT